MWIQLQSFGFLLMLKGRNIISVVMTTVVIAYSYEQTKTHLMERVEQCTRMYKDILTQNDTTWLMLSCPHKLTHIVLLTHHTSRKGTHLGYGMRVHTAAAHADGIKLCKVYVLLRRSFKIYDDNTLKASLRRYSSLAISSATQPGISGMDTWMTYLSRIAKCCKNHGDHRGREA